jgi:hypothetical protein
LDKVCDYDRIVDEIGIDTDNLIFGEHFPIGFEFWREGEGRRCIILVLGDYKK